MIWVFVPLRLSTCIHSDYAYKICHINSPSLMEMLQLTDKSGLMLWFLYVVPLTNTINLVKYDFTAHVTDSCWKEILTVNNIDEVEQKHKHKEDYNHDAFKSGVIQTFVQGRFKQNWNKGRDKNQQLLKEKNKI